MLSGVSCVKDVKREPRMRRRTSTNETLLEECEKFVSD